MDCFWSRQMPVGGLALRREVGIAQMLTTPGNNVTRCHSRFVGRSGGSPLPSQLGFVVHITMDGWFR